jgi:methylmalonyl-CoA mutase, N-terminal domain
MAKQAKKTKRSTVGKTTAKVLKKTSAKKLGSVVKASPKNNKTEPKKKKSNLFDALEMKALSARVEAWKSKVNGPSLLKMPERKKAFITDSGVPIPALLTPLDLGEADTSLPGEFPFTRGVQSTTYRSRLWTMRQFAGFGTPADTNKRFKYLIAQGMTGLSTAFDMPALMGYDADHPMSQGEVGKEGVAVSSLKDFEILFDGIPLDKVTTSMTINASAIAALAMYIAVAEKQGISMEKLGGTIQNDMLKEYIAQKEWIVGPRPAVRIVIDMIEFCSKHMPKWHAVSISGYHIREAGATAVQELAFTLADGIGYVDECLKRGLNIDDFAPRLSFFWDVHNDFFEEIAKFRAARRMWAKIMRDKGAKDPRSMMLRTHAQTAGVSLTAQQPYNNVVRVSLQALAAVLGGTQSLHTNSLDETYALPTEESVTIAMRTQQLIAHESGVDRVVDPLGGSYYVEHLTDEMEKRAFEYIHRIDEMGGIIRAVEEGYPQKEIGESAYRYQREVEQGDRLIVGVNAFKDNRTPPMELLKIDEEVTQEQIDRLKKIKQTRDAKAVKIALAKVEEACRNEKINLMPPVIEAVKAYVTLGEISDVFRKVWGAYSEGGIF